MNCLSYAWVHEWPHLVQVKRSMDLSCLTPACSPETKDMLRTASGLPHEGQVSFTLACSDSVAVITSIEGASRGSMVFTSTASVAVVKPHLVHLKPPFTAFMYEPHFSQNFNIPPQNELAKVCCR